MIIGARMSCVLTSQAVSLSKLSCSRFAISHNLHSGLLPVTVSGSRLFATDSQTFPTQQYNLANLTNRSIISVSGPDAFLFVQALITNDVRHLQEDGPTGKSSQSIYSYMLNNSGRILADLFLYSLPNMSEPDNSEPLLLLEVDSGIGNYVYSILKRYKIRRKLKLKQETDWNVSVIYPSNPEQVQNKGNIIELGLNDSDTILVQDPRKSCFGYRLLSKNPTEGNQSLISREQCIDILSKRTKSNDEFKSCMINWVESDRYRTWRYQNGIGEGSIDFPLEACFPFEANAELLNGISFQKGCFIGQELTARTYHTGVIRKRLLPIEFVTNADGGPLPRDLSQLTLATQNVVDQNGKIIGRFRANFKQHGIATLKFADLFPNKDKDKDPNLEPKSLTLSQSGHSIRVFRPFWWPESL